MGFTPADQDALEQARDSALANHQDYWTNNGHTLEENTFFPGFEAGWHAANEKLVNGEELPGDLEQWAKNSGSHHWESEHGFRQGAEAARAAGHHEEQDHQEEEQHDEE